MDNNALIKQRRDTVIEQYGPWSTHSTHLGAGIYTSDEPKPNTRLRRCLQIAADIIAQPLDKIRVLDLACLEGEFAVEFASQGAAVVGIEGREINIAKARFSKELLSLHNLELVHDDVRNLSSEKYGRFDLVLALGILYHLDAPAVMDVVRSIFDCCTRVVIIDTHFSPEAEESYTWQEHSYWGSYAQEHDPSSSREEQLAKIWMSIGNARSFHMTTASFSNLLRHVGFTSVYECLHPHEYYNLRESDTRHSIVENRITFIAIKGAPQRVMSSPISQASPEIDRAERAEYLVPDCGPGWVNPDPSSPKRGLARRLVTMLPGRSKFIMRKLYKLAVSAVTRPS